MFQIEKKGSDKMTTWELIFIILGILGAIQIICDTVQRITMIKNYEKAEKQDK